MIRLPITSDAKPHCGLIAIWSRTRASSVPGYVLPVLVPLLKMLNVDLVHFGMVMTFNTCLGLVHPPLGICLYIVSGISGVKVERMLNIAEYKRRQAAPGVKVTLKNFGRDRRYPIVNRFRDTGAPLPQPDSSLLRNGAAAKSSAVDV